MLLHRHPKPKRWVGSDPQVVRQLFGNFSYFEQLFSFRATFCILGNFSSYLLILRYRSSGVVLKLAFLPNFTLF